MSAKINLIEQTDYWTIPTSNLVVYRCIIDHAFSIVAMSQSHPITIEIENDFALKSNGATQTISPLNITTVGEALAVLKKPLDSLKMYKTGKLEIQIEEFQITVASVSEYEAWQIFSDNGLRVICIPSGQLAIWLPISD